MKYQVTIEHQQGTEAFEVEGSTPEEAINTAALKCNPDWGYGADGWIVHVNGQYVELSGVSATCKELA